jgi:hypothetical protein
MDYVKIILQAYLIMAGLGVPVATILAMLAFLLIPVGG